MKKTVESALIFLFAFMIMLLLLHEKDVSKTGNVTMVDTITNLYYLIGVLLFSSIVVYIYWIGNHKRPNAYRHVDYSDK